MLMQEGALLLLNIETVYNGGEKREYSQKKRLKYFKNQSIHPEKTIDEAFFW